MAVNKYGTQPGVALLRKHKIKITEASQRTGVSYNHLRNSLYGYCTPKYELRSRLGELLGVEVSEIWTAESLAAEPYYGDKGRRAIGRRPKRTEDGE